jgi:hypothetical protein
MQVAELTSADTEFEAAETMRSGHNTVPRTYFAGDPDRE